MNSKKNMFLSLVKYIAGGMRIYKHVLDDIQPNGTNHKIKTIPLIEQREWN